MRPEHDAIQPGKQSWHQWKSEAIFTDVQQTMCKSEAEEYYSKVLPNYINRTRVDRRTYAAFVYLDLCQFPTLLFYRFIAVNRSNENF